MGFEKARDALLFSVDHRGEYARRGAEKAFEKGDFIDCVAPRSPFDGGGVTVVCKSVLEKVLETIEFWSPAAATDLDESRQPAVGGGGRFFLETFFLSRQFERDAMTASVVFCKEIIVHGGMVPPNQIFFNL